MPIGFDIADVLDELGTPFVIHYIDGSSTDGGKLDYEFFSDHSSEFIRQFFYATTLPYDTIVSKGDIISFNNDFFIVTNIISSLFEGGIVDYSSTIFRLNVFGGTIKRFSDNPGYDANYQRLPKWADVYTNVRGLHTEARFGPSLEDFNDVMELPVDKDLLYLTGNYDLEVGDRWYLSPTEYYKIDQISVRRLDNVNIVALSVDTRL